MAAIGIVRHPRARSARSDELFLSPACVAPDIGCEPATQVKMEDNDTAARLPSGTVTFMFTDIEGSTELANALGPGDFSELISRHHELLRSAIGMEGGVVVATEGDSFFAVFADPVGSVRSAVEIQRAIASEVWPRRSELRVRIGMHTGEGVLGGDNYVGVAVHKASRIANAAHGGQITVSAPVASAVDGKLPEGVTVLKLGKFRLAGFQEAETIFQLAIEGHRDEFPPLRGVRTLSRLPDHPTNFVGRTEQLAEGERLLRESRLVTFTGPGGTGKTRLSIEVARRVEPGFTDGAYFASLSAIDDSELIATTILEAIGLSTAASVEPADRLVSYVADKEMLLVLDNMEQLLFAGAEFVADLLDNTSRLKLIVTSRAPLRIMAERELSVPPFSIPDGASDVDAIADSEAVRLFLDRASAVRPGFELTSDNVDAVLGVTRRLDGLPLAIELVASQMRTLTPGLVLERLDNRMLRAMAPDLPPRQQTIANAIGWSYDLMAEEDKRVFARCSVFSGSFGLAEAERVASSKDQSLDVLDSLVSLVENSLLQQVETSDQPRYRLLIVVKEYAYSVLVESGEADTYEKKHASVYRELAERANQEILSSKQGEWLDRLALDHDNLRAAFDRSVRGGDVSTALRLVAALWRFWQMRGHLPEARQRAELALSIGGDPDLDRARCLMALGGISYWQGEWSQPLEPYSEALAIFSEHGDDRDVADAMYNLAFPVGFSGDFDRAERLLEDALRLFEGVGDRVGVGRAYWGLGNLAMYQSDWTREIALMAKAIDHLETEDAPFDLGWAHFLTAFGHQAEGDDPAARKHLMAALDIFADVSDMSAMTLILEGLALNELRDGRETRAAKLAGASQRIKQDTGVAITEVPVNQYQDLETLLREGDASIQASYSEGAELILSEAIAYARG